MLGAWGDSWGATVELGSNVLMSSINGSPSAQLSRPVLSSRISTATTTLKTTTLSSKLSTLRAELNVI